MIAPASHTMSSTADSTCSALASHPSLHTNLSSKQETELLIRLRQQVDFYFSPSNLAKDAYLQQLLQQSTVHGGAVPVSAIASFPKIRELHAVATMGSNMSCMTPPADPQLLCRAIEASDVVALSPDAQWIIPTNSPNSHYHHHFHHHQPYYQHNSHSQTQRPLTSPVPSPPVQEKETLTKERTTIIVRDLPQNFTEDEVLRAFTTEHVSPKTSRPDVGNTWYLTFSSETEAMGALAASQNRTIGGYIIRARLKNELNVPNVAAGRVSPGVKSSTPSPPPPPPPPPFASLEANSNLNPNNQTPAPMTASAPTATPTTTTSTANLQNAPYATLPMPKQAILHQYSMLPSAAIYPTYNSYGFAVYPPHQYTHAGYVDSPMISQRGYPATNKAKTTQSHGQPTSNFFDTAKKRPNKRRSKRNSNNSRSSSSPQGERREQPPSDKSPSSPSERREEPSPSSAQSPNPKNKKRQSKKKTSKMLSDEHFPALTTNKTQNDKVGENKRLYAEALLKLPQAASLSSGEPTGQAPTLEQAMQKFTISAEHKTEQFASQGSGEILL